jgi:hypothetical protein
MEEVAGDEKKVVVCDVIAGTAAAQRLQLTRITANCPVPCCRLAPRYARLRKPSHIQIALWLPDGTGLCPADGRFTEVSCAEGGLVQDGLCYDWCSRAPLYLAK